MDIHKGFTMNTSPSFSASEPPVAYWISLVQLVFLFHHVSLRRRKLKHMATEDESTIFLVWGWRFCLFLCTRGRGWKGKRLMVRCLSYCSLSMQLMKLVTCYLEHP